MAGSDLSVPGSYLSQSLAKHRILVLTIAGFAVGSSIIYFMTTTQQNRQVRPLNRRNAVHRRARQPGHQASNSGNTLGEENAQNRGIGEIVDELADAPAETEVGISQSAHPSAASSLQEMVYYIAEESSYQRAYVHRGITCDECGTAIRGIRYKCANCSNFDLCSNCEAHTLHPKTHVFLKIKIPVPALLLSTPMNSLYPGTLDDKPSPNLPKNVTRGLLETTKFELDEIQAFFDIFLSYTNRLWESDPAGIGRAIDSGAFEAAWRPRLRDGKTPPNILCDRIFAFFDSDQNGLVGFIEFVHGVAIRKKKSREPQNGIGVLFYVFDADKNGWVSRKDILRIFNGYYQLQKSLVLEDLELDLETLDPASEQSVKTIYSTRPLNSMLNSLSLSRPSTNPTRKDSEANSATMNEVSSMISDSNDQEERRDIIVEVETLLSAPNTLDGRDASTVAPTQHSILEKRRRRQRFYLDEEEGCSVSGLENLIVPNGKAGTHNRNAKIEENVDESSTSANNNTVKNSSRTSKSSSIHDDESSSWESADESSESRSSRQLSGNDRLVLNGYNVPLRNANIAKEIVYQLMQESINRDLDWLFKAKEELALEVEKTKKRREEWRQSHPQLEIEKDVTKVADLSLKSVPVDLHDANTSTDEISQRYIYLNYVEAEIERAGGPGRLSYSEFEQIMSIDEGKRFEFLASWLDLGNF